MYLNLYRIFLVLGQRPLNSLLNCINGSTSVKVPIPIPEELKLLYLKKREFIFSLIILLNEFYYPIYVQYMQLYGNYFYN